MGAGSLSSYNMGASPSNASLPTSQPFQFAQAGMSQPYQFGSMGSYMGQPSAPMSFANTGTAPTGAEAAAGETPGAASTSSFNPIGFGLGAVQTIGGISGMRKLNRTPWPEYKASQGTLAAAGRAQQLSQMGYTPAQAAAFKANMGTALNTQFSNQVNMAGGGLAGALGARGTAQKLQAMNQFAATDAEKQMGNIRYADQQTANLQSLQNMQTQASMQRRMALENAYGAAIKQGSENMAGAFDTGAAFANMAKYFGRTA